MGVSDNSKDITINETTERNINKYFSETNVNKSEIVNDIHTAYEKVYDIATKIKQAVDQQTDVDTDVTVNQTNFAGGTISGNKGGSLNVKQVNEAKITLALKVAVESIQNSDVNNDVKSIMYDMLNLTQNQSADVKNKNDASSAIAAEAQQQQDMNIATFLPSFAITASGAPREAFRSMMRKEGFLKDLLGVDCMGLWCDNSLNVNAQVNNILNENQTFDFYNETENKNKNIQSYVQSLDQKFENISELQQNLRNNITLGMAVNQVNEFKYDILDNEDYDINFEQINKVTEEISVAYDNVMKQVGKAIQNIITEGSSETKNEQTTATTTDNSNAATSDDTFHDVQGQTTEIKSKFPTWAIVVIVVFLVIGIVVTVLVVMFLKPKKKDESSMFNDAFDTAAPLIAEGIKSSTPQGQAMSAMSNMGNMGDMGSLGEMGLENPADLEQIVEGQMENGEGMEIGPIQEVVEVPINEGPIEEPGMPVYGPFGPEGPMNGPMEMGPNTISNKSNVTFNGNELTSNQQSFMMQGALRRSNPIF